MEKLKYKNFNCSFALLKIILSFVVVCCHFYSETGDNFVSLIFSLLRKSAVPCFMLISFYFFGKKIDEINLNKLISRLIRLSKPIIFYSILYFVALNLLYYFFNFRELITLKSFFLQLFFSHSYNCPMWFQFDLILLTIVLYFINLFTKTLHPNKKLLIFLLTGLIIPFISQYCGINYKFFNRFPYELRYPLGRFMEVLPYATLGYIISYFNVFDNKKKAFHILILISIISISVYIFGGGGVPNGFHYSGTVLFVFSIFIFYIFYFSNDILFYKVKNLKFKKVLRYLSERTLGIYCSHWLIGLCAKQILKLDGTILDCFIIFILSLNFSILLHSLPFNFFKEIV